MLESLSNPALKCIFWGSSFNVYQCSEIHFLREQFWSAPMFWNAFFEGEVLICTNVLKCIFWGSSYYNFLIYGCWLVWLLSYVFYQSFHRKQNFSSLDMYKCKSNWLQWRQVFGQRHMFRMIATLREILFFPR